MTVYLCRWQHAGLRPAECWLEIHTVFSATQVASTPVQYVPLPPPSSAGRPDTPTLSLPTVPVPYDPSGVAPSAAASRRTGPDDELRGSLDQQ